MLRQRSPGHVPRKEWCANESVAAVRQWHDRALKLVVGGDVV